MSLGVLYALAGGWGFDNDGLSDGARHTQVHTKTTINIYLGDYTSVVVPEYGWIGGSVALLAGIGVIGFMRQRS